MTITQLLKRLKMTKKPEIQKELILQAWQENENFFVGLQLSCDPTTKVVVDKVAHFDVEDDAPGSFSFQDFINLYDQVTQVDMDPSKARELILDAAAEANAAEWNHFYRRILLKKLQDDLPMDVIAKTLSELTGIPFVL